MKSFTKYISHNRTTNILLNKKTRNSTIMEDIFRLILFSIFFIFIFFMLVLGYFTYLRDVNYSKAMLEEETKSVSTEVDHYFKDIVTVIDMISYSPILKEANNSEVKKENLLKVLTIVESASEEINNIMVGFEDNTLLMNNTIFSQDFQFKETEWYKKAIQQTSRSFYLGNFPTPEKQKNPKLLISKSFSSNSKKQGVITIDCEYEFLFDKFIAESTFKSKKLLLVNADEQIVIGYSPDEIDQIIISEYPEMFDNAKSSFSVKRNKKKYHIYSCEVADSEWLLVSRINYSEIVKPIIIKILLIFLMLFVIVIIVSKILSIILGRAIAKPVVEVSSALQDLAKGKREIRRIGVYPKNEIGIMAESFNTFLETTELLKSDINELEETKEKLTYSLSLLNASLESTDDGILIIGKGKRISKWNDRFMDIWGATNDDMESRDDNIVLPQFIEKVKNAQKFLEVIKQNSQDPESISFDIVELKNGKIIERYSFPQKVEEKVVGRVWRFRDITKIREAEILLQDSEEKHRVMFTQTVDAYCILNDGIFTDANQAAEKILASPSRWLVGKTPLEISPIKQADGELSSIKIEKYIRIANEKGRHSFDWIHCRYDGSEFPAEITLIKIKLKEKDSLLAIWRDVTQEKAVAEKLKLSEHNFRHFFETMEDMIIISDKKGNIRYANDAVHDKLGYSLTELTRMNVLDLNETTENSETNQIIDSLIKGENNKTTLPVITKDGIMIPVETKTWLGKWNGEDSLFAIIKDISKEQEALFKFNKIFESNPALMALSSYPERKFIDVNSSFCKIIGYSKEEVIGKTSKELKLIMELRRFDAISDKLVKEGNFTNIQMSVTSNKGRKIDGLFSGELIETNGKKFFLTVMTDITNLTKMDKKLRKSERKYRLLFGNMTTGFALHEMIYNEAGEPIDYRFLDVNPAFEQFTGFKAENLIGKTAKEVMPMTEDYWFTTYGKVAKSGKAIDYEQYSQEFDKYFEVRAFSPEPNKFATIFSDTTARVKALKELEKEKEIAQSATKAKSEFLANMSHEIRTPLNGVIGFTDLLLSTDLTSSQKQFAINANVSGKALLGIISDVLDFSKIEAGKMELDIVNSSLNEILEQSVDIIKFSACNKKLDIILNIPIDFPDRAMIDPLRLKQILLNLLNNAIKFTNEGEIELSAKFIPYDDATGRFIFSVKDTGIGISETASKRLFQAFSQADGSITRKYGGTGLGLVISNYLAAKMGSHIDFISEEGKGSEFYFAIDTEFVEKSICRKDILKGKRVLIADKNSNFMDVISRRFKYWGFEVDLVDRYEDIAEKSLRNEYSVLLIDERLIESNDFQLINTHISKFKSANLNSSIIVTYCPNDDMEIVNLSKKINVDHMLTKPLIVDELFRCIQETTTPDISHSNLEKPAPKAIVELPSDKEFKILIAEDVEMNMILIKTLLKKLISQVEIHEARNGMEAVHLFKKISPDLILMDIQMPELDGLEATKAIKKLEKKLDKTIPVIALTAGAFSEDREKCLNVGMVDFLTKPISIKELRRVLAKYLLKQDSVEEL